MPTATIAARNGAAAPAAAIAPVTETVAADFTQTSTVAGDTRTRITEALTTMAGLSDAVTTELKIAAMTEDYPQASHYLGDPTAWV